MATRQNNGSKDAAMESTLDQKQGEYHQTESVDVSCEFSELAASAAPPASTQTPLYTPTEHYGSWAQYEQVQYQSTTVVQSAQTATDQVPGQHYAYPPQEPQVAHASVSAAEAAAQYAVSSAAETYHVAAQPDASQAYGPPSVPATTVYDSVTSFTTYASAQSQQTAEAAYMAPAQMQQSVPTSQSLPGQPMYMTQTVTDNQFQGVPPATPSWVPAQAPMLVQAQYTVQGGVQTGASPYQTLVVGPDGQYYTQVPLPLANQGPATVVYQTGPNGVQYMTTQSATGQMMVQTQQQPSQFGRKIWNKETAVQAKEATINATKKAYGKSKEFIVNKDGARAVAKTTWRQSKDVMVKTTDMMDKYVKPLMPFIAAADPELAASLRATSQIGRIVKTQDRKNLAQAKNGPAAQQNSAQPQLDAAALANLAPLLALLQQTTQLNAASGNQQGNDAQAQTRLLAALLQVQQQQPQQPQIQQPQIQQLQAQQQQPQQPQSQRPYVQQQQQQQQYQAQQPLSQLQPNISTLQSPHGQFQQPQIQQPVNEQQPQPTHPQSNIQQQFPQQSQQWQQPIQQPQIQQQQQIIPRRKPISSNPASHQQTAPPAPSASGTASEATADQLASFLDSQLTLQDQLCVQDKPQNTTAETWMHHAFRTFGIDDILLPPGSFTQSQTPPHTVTGNLLPQADASFEIEPFSNSTLLQQRINDLQSIPMASLPPNPPLETQLLEPLAVRPELNRSALVAADCLVGLAAGQRTSYKILLQSSAPQGYGISIASNTATSVTEAAKDAVKRMVGSIRWAAALEEGVSN